MKKKFGLVSYGSLWRETHEPVSEKLEPVSRYYPAKHPKANWGQKTRFVRLFDDCRFDEDNCDNKRDERQIIMTTNV